MIDGVIVKKLKVVADERGYLMEMLRADDPFFQKFGQAYLTVAYPGVVKGWHYHKIQTDHFVAVSGMVKVVLYDQRKDSKTCGEVNEFFMGDSNPIMLRIPVGTMHGYKTCGLEPSLLVNFPTELYNPKEPDEFREPYDSEKIPYSWEIKFT